jgi:membrane fusion protein (multidrug efflux system)
VAEHMRSLDQRQVELVLSEGKNFDQIGKMAKIEHDFNDEPRSFTFRADFSNPDRVLRHGQTCTVFIRQVPRDVLVIPQKATCEVRQKRYVYVIDHDDVAHQREVVIQYELGDLFVVRSGVSVDDKIVLDGIGQVLDGEKVDYEER